ncbi:MAG: hypothetical protein SPK76_00675, partial [Bacteroidales bacterium]|nr:hypothetical protein [Bacteroidales bacterium]
GKTGDITEEPYLDPDMMYVIVCGGSQSIKYIRKAKLKNSREDTVPEDLYPFPEGDRTVTLYDFEVQLELSDQARTIHFLGNVDENQLISGSYAYDNLPTLLSYSNKQAYWQELHVPGIFADYDKQTGEPIMDGHCYVPDPATEAYFQYIPLIRNFAKIQVTNESENFQLHSYAVIFYPERGSVAPFRSNAPQKRNGFDFNANLPSDYWLSGYEKCSFENLSTDIDYPGNMPAGVALSDVVPTASEFIDPDPNNGRVLLYDPNDTESGFYVYERGVPTDKIGPTFIIVCGKFETDDNWYYYRLDLMETKVEDSQTATTYYPIYRNFRYNIQLHRISSEGVLTPEAAVNSTTAEDISADISMRHLSDISNGTTRLVVEPFMTRTYSGPAKEGEYYTLYARFFNSVYSDEPDLSKVSVRVELEPLPDNASDILILYDDTGKRIASGGFFFPEAKTVGGVEGIRTIRFNTVKPGEKTITQKIKIIGHNPLNPYDMRLYREVEITLQNKQPLTLTCTSPVSASTSASITLDLTVPSSLPESMFPLKFYIEPERMTLTPDISKDVNLPVVSGRSIATTEAIDKDTPAFQYIRTLTWEEYSNLSGTGNQRTFHCYFKPNRPLSATTIWAYNEYFTKARVSFNNILPLTLTCTDPVLEAEGEPIRLDITTYSNLPESMFPLQFYIKPDASTIMRDEDYDTVEGPDVAGRFIRTLEWNEYSNLPVTGEMRTFYCYFKSAVPQSATTIRVSNENFETANVSFHTKKSLPTNHFWVYAEEDCSVQLNYGNLQYKIDGGEWENYKQNDRIELTAGQKVSFKGGSNDSKKIRTVNGAFKCTGGKFRVGGTIASLMVGDDCNDVGASITGATFIDFFKAHTGLIDASELELPMLTLAESAYKSMFDSCTNLELGPQILPATTLGKKTCYRNMFYNCSALKNAPIIAATKLKEGAYQRMFYGCSKVNYIKMLSKEDYRDDAFFSDGTNWCAGVAATGELWLDPSLKDDVEARTDWGKIVPPGWTVKYIGIDDVEQP